MLDKIETSWIATSIANGLAHHGPFGNDDNPVTDVPAVAVLFHGVRLVHQTHSVSDAGVLVHDHAMEDDIGADADRDVGAAVVFVLVGARPESAGAAQCAD